MGAFCRGVDELLRGRGRFDPEAPVGEHLPMLFAMVLLFGALFGAAMGSFSAGSADRWMLIVYAAVKVPMLLVVTFLICVPSFFVVNTLAGLRDDWSHALGAVVATQACVTLVLASLAPVILLSYACNVTYEGALVLSGMAFAVAAGASLTVTLRYYRVLMARNRWHRLMIAVWLVLYVFVGIQLAWMLRPFVGSPGAAPAFFREGAWGNAYVVVARLIAKVAEQLLGL